MDDNKALSIIEPRLKPGERLIWYSAPYPWRAAFGYFVLFILSFMVLATCGYAATMAAALPATIIFMLVAGVALCFAALDKILDCWKTVYGLTDSRLVIAIGKGGWWSDTKSYGADDIEPLTWTGGADWGSLYFGERWGEGGWTPKGAFLGIAYPARVIDLITETLLNKSPCPRG